MNNDDKQKTDTDQVSVSYSYLVSQTYTGWRQTSFYIDSRYSVYDYMNTNMYCYSSNGAKPVTAYIFTHNGGKD